MWTEVEKRGKKNENTKTERGETKNERKRKRKGKQKINGNRPNAESNYRGILRQGYIQP
jgi:hypothetical protein